MLYNYLIDQSNITNCNIKYTLKMKIPSPAWNNKRGPHPCLDIKKGGCIFKKKKKKKKNWVHSFKIHVSNGKPLTRKGKMN